MIPTAGAWNQQWRLLKSQHLERDQESIPGQVMGSSKPPQLARSSQQQQQDLAGAVFSLWAPWV